MSHFLLGIDIIFPVFFVLLVGYFARQKRFLDANFVDKSTWIVFYIALPLKLFSDIRGADIQNLHIPYVLYILLGISLIFFGTWFFARFFIKDRKKLSAFIHCAYRSNFVYVGFPILEALYDKPSAELIIVVLAFGLTLYNILAIFILTYYSEDENKKVNPLSILVKIIKNPMIISIFLGVVFNFLHIPIYKGLDDGIALISALCTPLSLILIGASLDFSSIRDDLALVLSSAAIKTVLTPLLLVPIGVAIGLSPMELGIAYVFWATPCAVNCFIFTKEMGSDYELASKIITTSFAFSIATYPIGVGILKYFGLI
ncbi:MAG: AEC family transporter [Peptoniphilus sp.]|nr:AEC family transporter [Peptoniphilus sp.]MDD7363303.1 AEC family transporter [Bacillota bacterium]MDY6045398.1 AEC family transporter [Peptoniphilus sp.]